MGPPLYRLPVGHPCTAYPWVHPCTAYPWAYPCGAARPLRRSESAPSPLSYCERLLRYTLRVARSCGPRQPMAHVARGTLHVAQGHLVHAASRDVAPRLQSAALGGSEVQLQREYAPTSVRRRSSCSFTSSCSMCARYGTVDVCRQRGRRRPRAHAQRGAGTCTAGRGHTCMLAICASKSRFELSCALTACLRQRTAQRTQPENRAVLYTKGREYSRGRALAEGTGVLSGAGSAQHALLRQ